MRRIVCHDRFKKDFDVKDGKEFVGEVGNCTLSPWQIVGIVMAILGGLGLMFMGGFLCCHFKAPPCMKDSVSLLSRDALLA
jgi:hypothetical protein